MTKPRPLWSSFRVVAALLLGGLLVEDSALALAADQRLDPKAASAKKAKKMIKPPVKAALPQAEIGPAEVLGADVIGLHGQASFYGQGFQGRKTSTGERFDVRQFTAASNNFPLGTMVAVRRLDNDRCAIVKINDRMHAKHRRRVIDVSHGVAEYLDMVRAGVVMVRVAPLKSLGRGQQVGDCHAAFEPEPECLSCGHPPRLPDFDGLSPGLN